MTSDPSLTQPVTVKAQPEVMSELTATVHASPSLTQSETTDVSLMQPKTQCNTTDTGLEPTETADADPVATIAQPPETTNALAKTTEATEVQPEAWDNYVQLGTTNVQPKAAGTTDTQSETTDTQSEALLTKPVSTNQSVALGVFTDELSTRPETFDALPAQPETADVSLSVAESSKSEADQECDMLYSVQCESSSIIEHSDKVKLEEDAATAPPLESQNVLEGAPTSAAHVDVEEEHWVGEEERESLEEVATVTDTTALDDTMIPVISRSEEVAIERDSSPVVLAADSATSEVTRSGGEPTSGDFGDSTQLSLATVDDGAHGEDRPPSGTGFDEECWVESGHLASDAFSVSESDLTSSTQSGPGPWMEIPSSVYDEDCWKESVSPVKVFDTRPTRILKRDDEPFFMQNNEQKQRDSQPRSKAPTDTDSCRTSRGEQSTTETVGSHRKPKNKKKKQKNRDVRDEKGGRYSPAPQSSFTRSGKMCEQPSLPRERGDGTQRSERQRYLDDVKQWFRREGSRDRPMSREVTSDSSKETDSRPSGEAQRRPTWGCRRYRIPQRRRYGSGWP